MATILIVASDERHAVALKTDFEALGHAPTTTDLEAMAEAAPGESPPDLVVVDVDTQGIAAFDSLRKHECLAATPTLGVVGETALDGTAFALKSKAHDFVIRPYRLAELEARVKSALWRNGSAAGPESIEIDGLLIDTVSFEVTVDAEPIDLTYKEYELLRFLASNPRRVFTRGDLLSKVWGYDYYGGTRTVDVHIRRLRAKLGPHHARKIETMRGVGYKLRA
jgi:DNA-binding response OmpR family regulator